MSADDFVEYLNQEAESEVAATHEFMLIFREEEDDIHLFFEGDEDPQYYLPEIRNHVRPRKFHIYKCGGKKAVIDARDYISTKGYRTSNCMFFVDRDFDDYLGCQCIIRDNTYITDYYSIENHIACDNALEVLLVDVLGFSNGDAEFQYVVESVRRAQARFHVLMRPLMAWTLAAKETGKKPNLANAKLSKMFKVDAAGNVLRQPSAYQIFQAATVKCQDRIPLPDVLRWARIIRSDTEKLWLRGKYELWLFGMAILAALAEISGRRRARGAKALKLPPAIRELSLIEFFGGRIQKPSSLCTFIASRAAVAGP